MDIQIFQYKESHLGAIRLILTEYMKFIANEIIKPPWQFNVDIEHEVDFTMNNLDKFAEPDGRLLLVQVDGEIAGTISLRKIRRDCGEIKRMYIKPEFRGKKLGNLMIEKVINISEENGFSKLFWTRHFLCHQQYLFTRNLDSKKLILIQNVLCRKNYGVNGFS